MSHPAKAALAARLPFLAATLVACLVGSAGRDAEALQYQRVPLDPPGVIILMRGPIIPGDFERLPEFRQRMPSNDRIVGYTLDSPGGNLLEASRIAEAMKVMNTTVLVDSSAECSSACFLLFAAATRRYVVSDALIGVHSASEDGRETGPSMAMTTAMAREAAALGVPPAIIGKLVETPPERATWLTPSDLASMGVIILNQANSGTSPGYRPSSPNAPPPQYYGSLSPSPAPGDPPAISKAYEEGLADRRAWENWFAGLMGAFKDGAEYWTGQRSIPKPGSCYGPVGQNLGNWTAGCVEAKRILAPSDIRRKSESDYRAGWNSY